MNFEKFLVWNKLIMGILIIILILIILMIIFGR